PHLAVHVDGEPRPALLSLAAGRAAGARSIRFAVEGAGCRDAGADRARDAGRGGPVRDGVGARARVSARHAAAGFRRATQRSPLVACARAARCDRGVSWEASMIALLLALAVTEGDATVRDFHFASGASMAAMKLHYRTLGSPGSPAVLVLHGTTGSGAQFLADSFAGALFGPGQLLDSSKYFIVLPDGIGHGGSTKPSDGLRAQLPRYGYADMIAGQRAVLDHLGVKHLRLIVGTSMG